jgi:hypothetical protein
VRLILGTSTPQTRPISSHTRRRDLRELISCNGSVIDRTGVGRTGVLLGAVRAIGWRPILAATATAATLVALIDANAPMTALGISDPRSWFRRPGRRRHPHLVFGAVTPAVLHGLETDS